MRLRPHGSAKPSQRGLRVLDAADPRAGLAVATFDEELERLAIVRAYQIESYGAGVVAVQDRAHREEVFERVCHLLPADRDQAAMGPMTGEWVLPRQRLTLRDLVFVVREDEVSAAPVDIELVTQRLPGHRGALDVPAGSARSPRARPGRLTLPGALPQGEVARVALSRLELLACRDELAIQVAAAEFPVPRKPGYVKVHVAVHSVGMARLHQ